MNIIFELIISPIIGSIVTIGFYEIIKKYKPLLYKDENFRKYVAKELEFYSDQKLYTLLDLPHNTDGLIENLLDVNNGLEKEFKQKLYPNILLPITNKIIVDIFSPNRFIKIKNKIIFIHKNKKDLIKEVILSWLHSYLKTDKVVKKYNSLPPQLPLSNFINAWTTQLAKNTKQEKVNDIDNCLLFQDNQLYVPFNGRLHKCDTRYISNDIVMPKELDSTINIASNIDKANLYKMPVRYTEAYKQHINKV